MIILIILSVVLLLAAFALLCAVGVDLFNSGYRWAALLSFILAGMCVLAMDSAMNAFDRAAFEDWTEAKRIEP